MGRRSALIILVFVVLTLLVTYGPGAAPERAQAADGRPMGYGVLAHGSADAAATRTNWVKIFAGWSVLEPSAPGAYSIAEFNALSAAVDSARSSGLNVLLSIYHTPGWASNNGGDSAPPINDIDFANFLAYLATFFKGRVGGYEIWNEQNLAVGWGNRQPDPVKFAAMLRALYPRVKAADPNALVVTGGLATAGDGIDPSRYGDLVYIRDLYLLGNVKSCSDGQGGLRSCFDALGSHPYGGPFAPEMPPSEAQYSVGMYFRRAEQQKQMMDVHGQDFDRGVFVTEFNWLIDPGAFGVSCFWGGTWDSYKLRGDANTQELTQADYLVRAFSYAYANWPWMMGMIVFNLDYNDFNGDGLGICSQVRWYSLKRQDGSWRPAYAALTNMAKPGIAAPVLSLDRTDVLFLLDPTAPNVASQTVGISNVGGGTLDWSSSTAGAPWLTLGVPNSGAVPSAGTPGRLPIIVNRQSLASGWHNGSVTVTAQSGAQVAIINVRLYIGQVHRQTLATAGKGL